MIEGPANITNRFELPGGKTRFNRSPNDKRPNAWLFTRETGKPWGHSHGDELVPGAARGAGLPEGVCLYTLRHSLIAQSLADGMATPDVARITGTSLGTIESTTDAAIGLRSETLRGFCH